MENDAIRRSIAAYEVEIANIRYFLREKRSISEWQDWLWRRVPKFTKETTKLTASTRILGRWGTDNACKSREVLYTDLLTLLVKCGDVVRERFPHTTTYKWVDKATTS